MEIILGIGGNRGDRLSNLEKARIKISERIGEITSYSRVIESEPWGFSSENWFLNQVLVVESSLSPDMMLRECLELEASMGRKRTKVYTDRTIDIDILFFGDRIINSESLVIPHPRLHERLFVLMPLAELRPGLSHPVFGITVSDLLFACKDSTKTRWYKTDHSTVLLP